MSLSINLGRLLNGVAFPRLPEIRLRIPNPFLPSPSASNTTSKEPSSLQRRLQEYLEDRPVEDSFFIDNGLLKAVPKKKVSHQRKRKRQLAPGSKQLKYLHHLNRCPSCGHQKRAHTLCMHCVNQIKTLWRLDAKTNKAPEVIEQELDPVDRKIIYPGKKKSDYEKKLEKKDYIERRSRTLPVSRK